MAGAISSPDRRSLRVRRLTLALVTLVALTSSARVLAGETYLLRWIFRLPGEPHYGLAVSAGLVIVKPDDAPLMAIDAHTGSIRWRYAREGGGDSAQPVVTGDLVLFDFGDRHVTAENLHQEATRGGVQLSLATVYNTLHQFTSAGLLRQVIVDGDKTYFDTNIGDHHHFYFEDRGLLSDIPGDNVHIDGLPRPPAGTEIERVEVVVRLKSRD